MQSITGKMYPGTYSPNSPIDSLMIPPSTYTKIIYGAIALGVNHIDIGRVLKLNTDITTGWKSTTVSLLDAPQCHPTDHNIPTNVQQWVLLGQFEHIFLAVLHELIVSKVEISGWISRVTENSLEMVITKFPSERNRFLIRYKFLKNNVTWSEI